MMRRAVLMAGLLLAATAGANAASAAEPAQVVQRIGDQGLSVLGPNISPQERLARFRQIFDRDFDTGTISRFVLGQYWRLASGPERAEFRDLFTQYISMVYSNRLAPYEGARMEVTGTRNGPDGTLVSSRIDRPNGEPAKIDWRMSQYGDNWKVVDVIVEGVSMAATQREEFASIIQRNGGQIGGLLTAMREKVGTGPEGGVASEPARVPRGGYYGGSNPPPVGAPVPPPR